MESRKHPGGHRAWITRSQPRPLGNGFVLLFAEQVESALLGCSSDSPSVQTPSAYSITRVARTMISGGMVRPSAFAVFRLTTSSNLVGCSTGRSPGFVPLRILST